MTTISIALATPARVTAASPQPLRLTARGRAVLGVLTVLLLACVMVLVAGAVEARGVPAQRSTVVVQEDDTLDSIAAAHLPHTPRFEAVMMIDRANQLNSRHVEAGQVLVIPAE